MHHSNEKVKLVEVKGDDLLLKVRGVHDKNKYIKSEQMIKSWIQSSLFC